MDRYYVNDQPQPTGEHEVHKESCTHGPSSQNQKYLGEFSNCKAAVAEARKIYDEVDGCYFCAKECHTR
jgi:hypothetical protein